MRLQGHWRTLRDPNHWREPGTRLWIAQEWIGEREWVHQGQRSNVLLRRSAIMA
jgi:hypothetical protein